MNPRELSPWISCLRAPYLWIFCPRDPDGDSLQVLLGLHAAGVADLPGQARDQVLQLVSGPGDQSLEVPAASTASSWVLLAMAQDLLTSEEARWGDDAARVLAEEAAERSLGEAEDRDQGGHGLPRGQVCWGDLDSAVKGAWAGDEEEGAGRHQGDPFSAPSDHLHGQDCLCVGEHPEVYDVD